jgi:hypothetical protein
LEQIFNHNIDMCTDNLARIGATLAVRNGHRITGSDEWTRTSASVHVSARTLATKSPLSSTAPKSGEIAVAHY